MNYRLEKTRTKIGVRLLLLALLLSFVQPLVFPAPDTSVYITKSGSAYHHNAGCRSAKQRYKTVTVQWAQAHGYKPCSKCSPPAK